MSEESNRSATDLADALEARAHVLDGQDWQAPTTIQMMREAAACLRQVRPTLQALTANLREIERHCPCGARPESLNTHPHVGGCPVAAAIDLAAALLRPDAPESKSSAPASIRPDREP